MAINTPWELSLTSLVVYNQYLQRDVLSLAPNQTTKISIRPTEELFLKAGY